MLNLFTHSTPHAQQLLRVPVVEEHDEKEVERWVEGSQLIPNIGATLDLLFVLLCMNYHLLVGHLGKKAKGFYLGYYRDPLHFYKREKALKNKHKLLVDKYFEINKKNKRLNKILKRNIRQYKQNWVD